MMCILCVPDALDFHVGAMVIEFAGHLFMWFQDDKHSAPTYGIVEKGLCIQF